MSRNSSSCEVEYSTKPLDSLTMATSVTATECEKNQNTIKYDQSEKEANDHDQRKSEVDKNEAAESQDLEDKPTTVSAGNEEVSSVSGDSDASSDSWYYDIYDLEEASKYPSQACFNVGSVVHATWLEKNIQETA